MIWKDDARVVGAWPFRATFGANVWKAYAETDGRLLAVIKRLPVGVWLSEYTDSRGVTHEPLHEFIDVDAAKRYAETQYRGYKP